MGVGEIGLRRCISANTKKPWSLLTSQVTNRFQLVRLNMFGNYGYRSNMLEPKAFNACNKREHKHNTKQTQTETPLFSQTTKNPLRCLRHWRQTSPGSRYHQWVPALPPALKEGARWPARRGLEPIGPLSLLGEFYIYPIKKFLSWCFGVPTTKNFTTQDSNCLHDDIWSLVGDHNLHAVAK